MTTIAATLMKGAVWLHIAAGPLAAGLVHFSDAFGLDVVFSPTTMSGLQSPQVDGYFQATSALCALLRGSGATFVITRHGAVSIHLESDVDRTGHPVTPMSQICRGIGEPYIEPPVWANLQTE